MAGCLNSNGGSPSDGRNGSLDNQDVLQRVAVDGTSVVVEVSSDAEIDRINLIQPNGELFEQRDLAAGSQQVSFEIGTAYPPGVYDVVALRGEDTVVETDLSVEPDIEIVEIGIDRNQPEKMWDSEDDEIAEEAFATVENRGSGPNSITKLLFIGDVPYPSDEEGTDYADDEDVSGIYDPNADSEVDRVMIGAGEQRTIYSSRSPFAFVPGAGTSCTDEQQSGEFSLTLETHVGGNGVSKTYSIQYSAADEEGDCEITISER
jgi:hypothetical protein